MFSTDPHLHTSVAPHEVAPPPAPPSGEWGWVVTVDGRVVRATVAAGSVGPETEDRRAA